MAKDKAAPATESGTDNATLPAPNIVTAPWKIKAGSEIPDRFNGAEVTVRLAGDTTDARQALSNMLALCGSDVQAVLDTFNSAARLDAQKAAKDLMNKKRGGDGPDKDDLVTQPADIQPLLDSHVIVAKRRGRVGAEKEQQKARAERMATLENKASEQAAKLAELRESNPAAAEIMEQTLRELGLL